MKKPVFEQAHIDYLAEMGEAVQKGFNEGLVGDAEKVARHFKAITTEMADLHAKKNKDYGNSFDITLDEDGLVVSKIRLGDKYRRFSQLIKSEAEVKDESIRDTLIDLAVYSIKTIMWMDDKYIDGRVRSMSDDKIDAFPYALGLEKLHKGVVMPGADTDGDYIEPLVFVDQHGNKLADLTPTGIAKADTYKEHLRTNGIVEAD